MTRNELSHIITALERANSAALNSTNKPADAVKAFAEAVGHETAAHCIAAMVRRVSWDGRISRAAKDWAAEVELPEDWARRVGDCYTNSIHYAHLSQLAEAMAAYQPEAEAAAEAEAEAEAPIDLRDVIIECLENMSTADQVNIHNNYCRAAGREDDHIYRMYEFDEVMQGTDPHRLACNIFYGDFCPAQDFFWFNGYGNLMSADTFPTDEIKPLCISEIAEYIEREHDGLCDSDVQAILDDYDGEG